MSETHTSVTVALINAWGVGTHQGVELRYDVRDPYFVRWTFLASPDRPWSMSRNLLECGTISEVAEGDVEVAPNPIDPSIVTLTLTSDRGLYFAHINKNALVDFLGDTYEIVPVNEEIDHSVAAIETYLRSFA